MHHSKYIAIISLLHKRRVLKCVCTNEREIDIDGSPYVMDILMKTVKEEAL